MQGQEDLVHSANIDRHIPENRRLFHLAPIALDHCNNPFFESVELAFGHVELRFVQHRGADVGDEPGGPVRHLAEKTGDLGE